MLLRMELICYLGLGNYLPNIFVPISVSASYVLLYSVTFEIQLTLACVLDPRLRARARV